MVNSPNNSLVGTGHPRRWWLPVRLHSNLSGMGVDHERGKQGESNIKKDSELPFRGLLAFTIILLLAPQTLFPVLAPFRIAWIAMMVSVSSLVFTRMSAGRPIIRFSSGSNYLLLLVAWSILTIPLSYWPGGSISFLTSTYLKTVVLFILLANVVNTLEKLTRIAWALVIIAIPLSMTTVLHFLSGVVREGERVVGYNAGLTNNPNDLALMLNLILPFCIALFLYKRRTGIRLLLAMIIGLMVAAVVTTFSRAGFLALAFIFLIYIWRLRTRPERNIIPVFLILCILALPFVPSSYYDRLSTITDIDADVTNSAQIRLRDTITAITYVAQHPLIGSGVGLNVLAMNELRGETWTQIHNIYLCYAVELGLPGLILFLIFFWQCIKNTREALESSQKYGLKKLFLISEAIMVSLFVFAIEGFFHPSAYQFNFYYIAGLAVALKTVLETEIKKLEGVHI